MNIIDLISLMADGKFHSGQAIASRFSVSRTAVWKAVQNMMRWGIQVDSVRGRGYRLRPVIELLERERIYKGLNSFSSESIADLIILPVVDSTNQYLKSVAAGQQFDRKALSQKAIVCLSEYQVEGRGRRGRVWHSPFGLNVLMSVSWRFDSLPAQVNTLSLILGVALIEALESMGVEQLKLKWPNDLYWGERKLAGILLELFGEGQGPFYAIAGIGLNLKPGLELQQEIDQPWVSLAEISSIASEEESSFSRNKVVATVLNSICRALAVFDTEDATPYIEQWQQFDMSLGREVKMILPSKEVLGVSRGIDKHGRLQLETNNGIVSFVSGEVSLRIN